jgi:ABC-type spermidine/putrescine transport system permease subunit I
VSSPDKSALFGMTLRQVLPIAPAMLFLLFFFALPLVILLSFAVLPVERSVATGEGLSAEPFLATLADHHVWQLWRRSFSTAAWATCLCLLLGYPLALVYGRAGPLARRMILISIIAPLLTSALVRSYAWIVILGRRGVINGMLLELGLIEQPLRLLNTDLAVVLGLAQIQLPFMVLPLIAVLEDLDPVLAHASSSLGASRVQSLLRITLPLSTPGIVAGGALVFALSFGNLIVPQMLGGGAYDTLAVQIYEQAIVVLDWTEAAILTIILLLSSITIAWLIARLGALVGETGAARR